MAVISFMIQAPEGQDCEKLWYLTFCNFERLNKTAGSILTQA